MKHYSLFAGPDLAVEFATADEALGYMAEQADKLLDADVALMVFDEWIAKAREVALVDARKLPRDS